MKKSILLFLIIFATISAQDDIKIVHQFEMINQVPTTPIKSQGNTGTCWAFATTSFFETELLRMGFDEVNLSEMFTIRNAYRMKADKYIRRHGTSNFGQGGQAHDLLHVFKKYGMVPEDAYNGNSEDGKYNHNELESVLKGMLDGVLKNDKITEYWDEAFNKTLDVYLGEYPSNFIYKEKDFTPSSFYESTKINSDDYIEFTSYINNPFYDWVELDIPDNWSNDKYFNVPFNDIIEIMDNALENGYSVCWDGDSGKDHFYRKQCYAVIPEDDEQKIEDRTEPEKEKVITEEMRLEAFNSFDVTDDHLMHIVGTAKNQNGTKFYYTKNSWGTKEKLFNGYWYMSESYVRLKTIAIMVHKDAVPESILDKLK